jgi:hypothetical protein
VTPRPVTQFVHSIVDGEDRATLRSVYKAVNPHHIEVVFRDRAYAIPKGSLRNETLHGMKNGSSITITTPDDIAFRMLYQYLTEGDYRSDSNKYRNGPYYKYKGKEMLSHMRMYRMATLMNNIELKEFVIANLNSDAAACNNPIPALEYAYHGPNVADEDDKRTLKKEDYEPTEAIRDWVRKYLTLKREGPKRCSGDSKYTRPTHNLDVLEDTALSQHWSALKQKGGLLVVDADRVRAFIKSDSYSLGALKRDPPRLEDRRPEAGLLGSLACIQQLKKEQERRMVRKEIGERHLLSLLRGGDDDDHDDKPFLSTRPRLAGPGP